MSPTENASIVRLSEAIDGYHADLTAFRAEAQPALDFYSALVATSRWLKYGVGIGAGVATILGSLRIIGIV